MQTGRGYNTEQLAQECGVTRRTIFRDLDALRQSGVPLVFDNERQGYCIPGVYYLPPTNFTPEEALAVIVLCQELGGDTQLPFYHPAHSAAVKLENSLPPRLRDHLRSVSGAVRINLASGNPLPGQQRIYDQLVQSIADRRAVRMTYASVAEKETICTKLSPYQLLFSQRSWYVIGRSSLHRATRTFNLGRVLALEPLEDKFTRPRGFSIERYLRNAWHLIPERGKDQEVLLKFSPRVAANVAEVVWHKTQRTEFLEDGSMLFRATVSGLWEISWWILGYGDEVEALEPPELREMIMERARRTLARYEE